MKPPGFRVAPKSEETGKVGRWVGTRRGRQLMFGGLRR